ncbi:MAG: right-handed parallel beta-helix repeat-containing protein [Candidatus Omnitrophota bacterium]
MMEISKIKLVNRTTLGLGMAFLSLLITGGAAYSATLTVNKDGSTGYATIQSAIDAAQEGDTIVIRGGTYNEDPNIGHINMPPLKKNKLTLIAANDEEVVINLANNSNRTGSLASLGADFGANDQLGFFIYGDNVTLQGLKIVQTGTAVNNLGIAISLTIISSYVTVTDCELVGPGAETAGDFVGMVVSPMDVVSFMQGKSIDAIGFKAERCKISGYPYAFASADLPLDLGVPVPAPESTLVDCEFTGNSNGIEIDDGAVLAMNCHIHDNIGIGVNAGDGSITLNNCVIENCSEHGVQLEDNELEENDAQGTPTGLIESCMILNCGKEPGHHGISMETGLLSVNHTVIAGTSGPNMFFRASSSGRSSTAIFDHCDLYKSFAGVGLSTTDQPKDVINLTMTNCIVVDYDGVLNMAGAISEYKIDYCDIFAEHSQLGDDVEFIASSNLLNVDPQYVDPGNGDFHLKAGSKAATAGKDGTYLGSKGLASVVEGWMLQ